MVYSPSATFVSVQTSQPQRSPPLAGRGLASAVTASKPSETGAASACSLLPAACAISATAWVSRRRRAFASCSASSGSQPGAVDDAEDPKPPVDPARGGGILVAERKPEQADIEDSRDLKEVDSQQRLGRQWLGRRKQQAEESEKPSKGDDAGLNSGGMEEFKRLWSLTQKEGTLFWLGISALLIGSMFKSLTPVAFGAALGEVQRLALGTGGSSWHVIQLRILSVLGIGLCQATFGGLRAVCMGFVTGRLLKRLRWLVYNSVLSKDLGWHDGREVGELTSRVNADCASVSEGLTVHFNSFLRSSVTTLFGAVYLFCSSRILATSLLAVWAVLAVLTRFYGRFTRRLAVAKQDKTASLNQAISEDFGLIRVVRSFGLEERQRKRFAEQSEGILGIDYRRFRAYGGFLAGAVGIASLMQTITLAAGALMVSKGTMTPEQLVASLLFVREVVDSSFDAIDQLTSLQQTTGKAKRIFDMIDWRLLNTPPAALDAEGAGKVIPAESLKGQISFKGATFTYPFRDEPILKDFHLEIEAGKTTALVGSSGSGKSTIISLVQRLYDVDGHPETLLLDGTPFTELDKRWLRSQLAVVTQEPRLFADTIFNNIALGADGPLAAAAAASGSPEQSPELVAAVHSAARAANAHDFIMKLPEGYETRVGDLKLLSGGQRQRLSIARALMRRPKVLILDEATSALDSQSEAAVQTAIDNVLRGGMTCIIVAHRLATVRNADKIVVMEHGKVVETGRFTELLQKTDGYFSKLAADQSLCV